MLLSEFSPVYCMSRCSSLRQVARPGRPSLGTRRDCFGKSLSLYLGTDGGSIATFKRISFCCCCCCCCSRCCCSHHCCFGSLVVSVISSSGNCYLYIAYPMYQCNMPSYCAGVSGVGGFQCIVIHIFSHSNSYLVA